MKKAEIARYIDYTILKPDALELDVLKLCDNAKKYNFKAVCVSPCYVKMCKNELQNSNTAVCTVIGFPHGLNTTEVKIFEGLDAIKNGADELDIVVNNSWTKSGKFDLIKDELNSFVGQVKKSKKDVVVKVIIETCLLTNEEKEKLANIVKNSGADFIRTSTGFSKGGATVDDVKLLRQILGKDFLIKASGGIRDYETAVKMIEAGANRLGVSAGIEIVNGAE